MQNEICKAIMDKCFLVKASRRILPDQPKIINGYCEGFMNGEFLSVKCSTCPAAFDRKNRSKKGVL